MSRRISKYQQLEDNGQLSLMPVFQVAAKKQILIDKLQLLSGSTQDVKSSQTSLADSTSEEKDYLPFWSEFVQALSDTLWLPTKTDLPVSGLISSNGSVNKITANSWFSTKTTYLQNAKWWKTFSLSYTSSLVDCTDYENTSQQSRKIRIYPQPELNKMWKQWDAAARYCYNQAIAQQRSEHKRIGKFKLRDLVLKGDLPQWVKDTPFSIRANAVFDAHAAYGVSKDAKFRSCRDLRRAIKFDSENYKDGMWLSSYTKGLTFKISEPERFLHNCDSATRLVRQKDRWYAVFPETVVISPSTTNKVIALDPGIRTFLTGYDVDKIIEIAPKDIGRITRLCQHLDDLISRAAKSSKISRRRMRLAAERMRAKIRNLVDELHKKVACYLTENYKLIFLPTFETSQMVAKAKRKINSKSARAMLSWSHYRFKRGLKHQANKRGCTVVDCSEAYTSKTCTNCGHVHKKLGGAKAFKCPSCGHEIDRDHNGARNIMLRALRDTALAVSDDGIAIAI